MQSFQFTQLYLNHRLTKSEDEIALWDCIFTSLQLLVDSQGLYCREYLSEISQYKEI